MSRTPEEIAEFKEALSKYVGLCMGMLIPIGKGPKGTSYDAVIAEEKEQRKAAYDYVIELYCKESDHAD